MRPDKKASTIYNHCVTVRTQVELDKTLGMYRDFILCLHDEDFNRIESEHIFFNAVYSPGSNSSTLVSIPANSRLITLEVNELKKYPKDECIAVLLHELGHAFNPNLKGEEGEFVADAFAASRGYGPPLKKSLQRLMTLDPSRFPTELTSKRIAKL